MKTQNFLLLAFCTLLLFSCKEEIREPFIATNKGNIIYSDWPSSTFDLRTNYLEEEKKASFEVKQTNFYDEIWADIQATRPNASVEDIKLIEIKLTGLDFGVYPFDKDTWEAFLQNSRLVFSPTADGDTTAIAHFEKFDGDEISMTLGEENLRYLLDNDEGNLFFEFSFLDKPDDEIKLSYYQIFFSYKYEVTQQ